MKYKLQIYLRISSINTSFKLEDQHGAIDGDSSRTVRNENEDSVDRMDEARLELDVDGHVLPGRHRDRPQLP